MVYSVSMKKKTTTISYSDTAKTLLKKLSQRLGISQPAVLELDIRTLAKQEGIREEGME
jgi:hypothetical protein